MQTKTESIAIQPPVLPESVADATVATWYKKVGDSVKQDEKLVDIETDKVVLEVVAPVSGKLAAIAFQTGQKIQPKQPLGQIVPGPETKPEPTPEPIPEPTKDQLSPAGRQFVQAHQLEPSQIPKQGSGPKGRVVKSDLETLSSTPVTTDSRLSERVPMTRLRAKIAERLLESQHHTATLTTFNEIDLHRVMGLRKTYQEAFEKKYSVRLGLMPFFVSAVVEALKEFPMVNASIDGTDILYHRYYDIGIAVSSERGLVVPVIRNADELSMAEIERHIRDFSQRASSGKLALSELTGGTFTISNGGVFGSLLSTPILNPPQTAILGMHKIMDRPVVEDGQIVIRPMMYVALSYDHRMIDGSESVRFLKMIKELLESPARALLGV